jgi:hypothetical protein
MMAGKKAQHLMCSYQKKEYKKCRAEELLTIRLGYIYSSKLNLQNFLTNVKVLASQKILQIQLG